MRYHPTSRQYTAQASSCSPNRRTNVPGLYQIPLFLVLVLHQLPLLGLLPPLQLDLLQVETTVPLTMPLSFPPQPQTCQYEGRRRGRRRGRGRSPLEEKKATNQQICEDRAPRVVRASRVPMQDQQGAGTNTTEGRRHASGPNLVGLCSIGCRHSPRLRGLQMPGCGRLILLLDIGGRTNPIALPLRGLRWWAAPSPATTLFLAERRRSCTQATVEACRPAVSLVTSMRKIHMSKVPLDHPSHRLGL